MSGCCHSVYSGLSINQSSIRSDHISAPVSSLSYIRVKITSFLCCPFLCLVRPCGPCLGLVTSQLSVRTGESQITCYVQLIQTAQKHNVHVINTSQYSASLTCFWSRSFHLLALVGWVRRGCLTSRVFALPSFLTCPVRTRESRTYAVQNKA